MVKKLLVLLLVFAGFIPVFAQPGDTSYRVQISLLTCGPGDEEVYEVFGHTAVRVIDSVAHTDEVYNYGTFAYGPDFELQFMKGKLLYYLNVEPFNAFMAEYIRANRSVEEQVLVLDWKQKEHIRYFLDWNAEPENKNYKYDFFFDNCATRIRDIFPRPDVFGKEFHYSPVTTNRVALIMLPSTRNLLTDRPRTVSRARMEVSIRPPLIPADLSFFPGSMRTGGVAIFWPFTVAPASPSRR